MEPISECLNTECLLSFYIIDCTSKLTPNVLHRITVKKYDKNVIFTCLHGILIDEDLDNNHWCCSYRILTPMDNISKILADASYFENTKIYLFTSGNFDVHPYYIQHLKKINKLKIWMPVEEIFCFRYRSKCWWNSKTMTIISSD